MSRRSACSLITVLPLLIASTTLAQQPPPTSSPRHEPITEDLSQGATFTFRIAPDLPQFTFKVVPEPQDPDEYGNPHATVRTVQVFRGNSKEPLQSLEDCEWEGMEPPARGSDWFRVQDMNFDGYNDIYVLTNWGATGNELGCVWLYDPKSSRFEFSKEFSQLGRLTLDPATKTIAAHSNGGMAGTIFRAAKYVIEDNRPVPVVTVAQDFDFATKKYHCIVQQRRGREDVLATVRDEWAESKGEFEGPCDPSDPFRGVGDK